MCGGSGSGRGETSQAAAMGQAPTSTNAQRYVETREGYSWREGPALTAETAAYLTDRELYNHRERVRDEGAGDDLDARSLTELRTIGAEAARRGRAPQELATSGGGARRTPREGEAPRAAQPQRARAERGRQSAMTIILRNRRRS